MAATSEKKTEVHAAGPPALTAEPTASAKPSFIFRVCQLAGLDPDKLVSFARVGNAADIVYVASDGQRHRVQVSARMTEDAAVQRAIKAAGVKLADVKYVDHAPGSVTLWVRGRKEPVVIAL